MEHEPERGRQRGGDRQPVSILHVAKATDGGERLRRILSERYDTWTVTEDEHIRPIRRCKRPAHAAQQASNLTSWVNAGAGTSEIALRCVCDGTERRLGSATLALDAGITWESGEFCFQGAQDRS